MSANSQITTRVPDRLIREIDRAARRLKRTRADVVRQAIEDYLDNLEDLRTGREALQDPEDPVLEWADVRRGLLGQDRGQRR